jgi:sec-independent protein translocase protein TatA
LFEIDGPHQNKTGPQEIKIMPDVGLPELLIILVIVLILFGPSRLTGLGTALGQSIQEFRRGLRGEDEINESNR